MRSFQKKLTMAAAGASLIAVIGVAMAQATQVGPDADVSNNETKTGIQNNSNNSYKTWPQSLYDANGQRIQAPATQTSTAPSTGMAMPQSSDNAASTQSSSANSASSTTDNSAAASNTTDNSSAMPAPKADRN